MRMMYLPSSIWFSRAVPFLPLLVVLSKTESGKLKTETVVFGSDSFAEEMVMIFITGVSAGCAAAEQNNATKTIPVKILLMQNNKLPI